LATKAEGFETASQEEVEMFEPVATVEEEGSNEQPPAESEEAEVETAEPQEQAAGAQAEDERLA
jgi:hypothetical protein